jgi:membrane protein
MKALFDGLNIAYDEVEKRHYVGRTALTYAFTLAALAFLAVMSVILVAAPIYLRRWGWSGSSLWWIPLRWLVLFAVAAAGFAVVYRYGPCRATARWRWVTSGAVFAATLWLGGSLGFSWYLNNIAHFDVTYGSLGAVIGFMMWIWFSVMLVLIGAELNAEIEHQTACDSTTGPAMPLGERGAAMADTVGLAFSVRRAWRSVLADGRRQAGSIVRRLRREPGRGSASPRPQQPLSRDVRN